MIKENIISNYYIKHQKVKEISEELGVSTAYITKIIKQDTRYSNEKQYRKERSKSKRKIDQNKFIKHKREKQSLLWECLSLFSYTNVPLPVNFIIALNQD